VKLDRVTVIRAVAVFELEKAYAPVLLVAKLLSLTVICEVVPATEPSACTAIVRIPEKATRDTSTIAPARA
jgi:hypothetical protein